MDPTGKQPDDERTSSGLYDDIRQIIVDTHNYQLSGHTSNSNSSSHTGYFNSSSYTDNSFSMLTCILKMKDFTIYIFSCMFNGSFYFNLE